MADEEQVPEVSTEHAVETAIDSNEDKEEGEKAKPEEQPGDPGPKEDPKEDTGPKEDPSKIVMANLKFNQTTHKNPSLPPVLVEYGLPHKNTNPATKKKHKHHHKHHREHSHRTDTEKEKAGMSTLELEERRRIRDTKFMHMCEDMHKTRGYFYDEYKRNVKEKIEKQAEVYQKRVEALEKEIQQKKDQWRKNGIEKRHKLMKKHVLTTDTDFLRRIYKSEVYKIMAEQDKLYKEGKLNSVTDMDEYRASKKKKKSADGKDEQATIAVSESGSAIKSDHNDTDRKQTSVLSVLYEGKKGSDKQSEGRQSIGMSPAKLAAMEMEQKFAKVQMPDLACYKMELGEKPPDPEEVQRITELKYRDQHRKLFVKKIRRMYQLSQTNTASSQRILDNKKDDGGPYIGDEIWSLYSPSPEPEMDPSYQGIGQSAIMALVPQGYSPIMEENEERSSGASSRSSTSWSGYSGEIHNQMREMSLHKKSTPKSTKSTPKTVQSTPRSTKSIRSYPREASGVSTVEPKPPGLHPLTMDTLYRSETIIESKAPSTLWVNYMKSGRNDAAVK